MQTSWQVIQRDSDMLMAVGQAGLYFVKRSMGESIAGVLNRWEISYWWEISSMQREILSDLVQ